MGITTKEAVTVILECDYCDASDGDTNPTYNAGILHFEKIGWLITAVDDVKCPYCRQHASGQKNEALQGVGGLSKESEVE